MRSETRVKIMICLLFFSLVLVYACARQSSDYTLVILNGTVIDGTGRPGFKADVGIRGHRVVKVGTIDGTGEARVIDARGKIVAPGFIDVHTHCDRGIAKVPTVDNYLHQGVTTVVGGNCGGHPFPLRELFKTLENQGISPNFACLIGHNTIRREVMEYRMDVPTPEEISRMQELIKQEMLAGGIGFSTGLSYLPGRYSQEEELVQLASAVAPYDGIYATHLRDQGVEIKDAIEEAIAVGERNGITIQISHIKLSDDRVWGRLDLITDPVEQARERGVAIYLDQYPYTATSSGFTSSFPAWAFEGGRDRFRERLKDRETRKRIQDHIIERRLTSSRGIDKLGSIYIASYEAQPEYNGKNLKEILQGRDLEPNQENGADLIIEIERNGGASGVFFQMDEEDVISLMQLPYNMHASDGGVQVLGDGVPHPRHYGTFPRVIAHYVHATGNISLEEAIRKMTSFPAEVFGFHDRGILREGAFADITVFNPEEFRDLASFAQPHQYGTGLFLVLVNGTIVVENDTHTGALPGKILYGRGHTGGTEQ